jgi:uncharacterized protein (DUF433 family)
MKIPERIEINEKIMKGKPCIKGTRIPVYILLEKLSQGSTSDSILSDYPQLEQEDIIAALVYAAELAKSDTILDAA